MHACIRDGMCAKVCAYEKKDEVALGEKYVDMLVLEHMCVLV